MVIDLDIPAQLRRARNQAIVMLAVTALGLFVMDSNVVFVVLAINAAIWLVRFWYYASQIYEHTLLIDRDDR